MTGFNSNYNQASPASYGQASPSYPSPCGSRNTPQGSPAPPAAARLPHQHSAESVCSIAANQQVKSPRLHCGALSKTPPVLPMSASTVAPLPVPVSVTAPVPVQGTPGRVAVDSLVVQRVSVITDQSKLVNTTDSTQSHNGGEVNAFFNSRQQSVNNQVGNSDCISSRTASDLVVKEENNMDYTLSGNFGAGLPEQLSRPMSESTSASSIPRTHTPHMAGESIALLISVGSCGYELSDSEKAFSFVEYGFMNEWKNRQILVCVVFSYITCGHGNSLVESD